MFDLTVVGAGVMGASIAYHAARKGASVLVVDKRRPGRATTAGAGIISTVGLDPDESDPVWLALVDAASEAYRSLFADLGETAARESQYAIVGELVVASGGDDRLDELERRVRARANPIHLAGGGPVRITGTELADRWPYIAPSLHGLYIPGTARVDGNTFADMLLSRAKQAGARVVHKEGQYSIDGGVATLTVGAEAISTAAVVIATGSWAGPLLTASGATVGVVADRGQIVHLDTGDRRTSDFPVLKTFDGPYILGFDDGRVVAGATHQVVTNEDASVRARDQLEVLSDALGVAPGLGTASIIETRVGFRPASSDGMPIVGETAIPGLYMATGLGSWGLTLSPLLGDTLTDEILHRPQRLDLAPLSPQRRSAPRAAHEITVHRGEIA